MSSLAYNGFKGGFKKFVEASITLQIFWPLDTDRARVYFLLCLQPHGN